MCKYCEPDEAGNLADIEHDGNNCIVYLEDWGNEWALTTEVNTVCSHALGSCWGNHHTIVRHCPMCGRKLEGEVMADES